MQNPDGNFSDKWVQRYLVIRGDIVSIYDVPPVQWLFFELNNSLKMKELFV